jgi:hypothetical protein
MIDHLSAAQNVSRRGTGTGVGVHHTGLRVREAAQRINPCGTPHPVSCDITRHGVLPRVRANESPASCYFPCALSMPTGGGPGWLHTHDSLATPEWWS